MHKLSIIVPVFNEERTIESVIEKIKSVKLRNILKEIIIVDDFSTDKTKSVIRKFDKNNVKVFYHKKNCGKGAAIRTGLKNSTGNIILIQDADLEYDPKEYRRLLEPIITNKASIVYGSRLKVIKKNLKKMYKLNYFGNILLSSITNLLYGAVITDMETGYKVFRSDVIKNINLKAKGFELEPEITAKVLKKGYRIKEVPIDFNPRKIEEGKKITWLDGIKAIYYLLKYRFVD